MTCSWTDDARPSHIGYGNSPYHTMEKEFSVQRWSWLVGVVALVTMTWDSITST